MRIVPASITVADMFAGPGGWDIACHWLGLDPVGFEIDPEAIATRQRNGLRTIAVSVAKFDPSSLTGLVGLIASPPCPQFSAAGLGLGRRLMTELNEAVTDALDGKTNLGVHRRRMARLLRRHILKTTKVTKAEASAQAWTAADEAALIVQPARWIAATKPEWVAMEQVPDALPVFDHYARELRDRGYSTWAGVLRSEQFGVPQTRRRAVVMASRTRVVHPPAPTHQRYVHGEAAGAGADCHPDLFSPGVRPWVSMAEALGWDEEVLVGFPRLDDGRPGHAVDIDGTDYRARDLRSSTSPAQAVTEKVRSWMTVRTGQNSAQTRAGETKPYERDVDVPAPTVTGQARSWVLSDRQPHGAERRADEPAPTITASLDNGNKAWVPAEGVLRTTRDQRPDGSSQTVGLERPAPTVTPKSGGQWTFERPATTIMGDPRCWPPGHKINQSDIAAGRTGLDRAGSQAIRLQVDEAATLQSFPPGFEFEGTKTAKFRQVGNAVPPVLGEAVLSALVS